MNFSSGWHLVAVFFPFDKPCALQRQFRCYLIYSYKKPCEGIRPMKGQGEGHVVLVHAGLLGCCEEAAAWPGRGCGWICGGMLSWPRPCAGRAGEGECSIKCSPASQLTSLCSFSLSMRQGNTAELIHRAFAELNISKALCCSLGLRKSKYHSLFCQRASGCQGVCLRKLQMYIPNNQNLRVYYTTGYPNLEDDIAFNCSPPPSFLPLNIKKRRVITEAMMIIDWKVFYNVSSVMWCLASSCTGAFELLILV